MSKTGKATRGAILHGLEGSKTWMKDQIRNKESKSNITYIPLHKEGDVYKSNVSQLRQLDTVGMEKDWGYYVAENWDDNNTVATSADNYVDRLLAHKKDLSYYDEVYTRKNKGQEYQAVRKRKAPVNDSFMKRNTIDVSPYISRAIQMQLERGDVVKIRQAIDEVIPEFIKKYESTFKGANLVGAGIHVLSGQLHVDTWSHGIYRDRVKTGKKNTLVDAQLRDYTAHCHYGSGSGIVAWNRHIAALGDAAKKVCPDTIVEVEKARAGKSDRALGYDRGDDANRDIAIHDALDELVASKLDPEILAQAKAEYAKWLTKGYDEALRGPKSRKAQTAKFIKLKSEVEASKAELSEKRDGHAGELREFRSMVDSDLETGLPALASKLGIQKKKGESDDVYHKRVKRVLTKVLSTGKKVGAFSKKRENELKEAIPVLKQLKNAKFASILELLEMILGIEPEKTKVVGKGKFDRDPQP